MFFGSYSEFLLIIVITLVYNIVRWTIPSQLLLRKLLLLAGSYVVLLTIIDRNTLFILSMIMAGAYVIAVILQSQELQQGRRKKLLTVSLVFLLFLFCVRNYSWFEGIMARNGLENTVSSISLVGRVGLSYILFRLLHFLVDAYRGSLNRLNVISFFNYIFFFPTYLSGPIDRYNNFSYWERSFRPMVEIDLVIQGIARLFIGSVKKFLIVPFLLPYVNEMSSFESLTSLWQAQIALTVLAYSFYIYFDFSGYSDIAIGSAYLLGIKTPENFNNPYFSKDIAEFWKRWHISFSSILGEYVFKPMVVGLTQYFPKSPRLRISIVGYLITFVICGLWHGNTMNFVYWGLWHGLGLSVFKAWQKMNISGRFNGPLRNPMAIFITFLFVTVGWYFFKTPTREIHEVFKNEIPLFNTEYTKGGAVKLTLKEAYWAGYGHGIDVYFMFDSEDDVTVQYKLIGSGEWITSSQHVSALKGRYQIHGSTIFLSDKRNLDPGLYQVRLKSASEFTWYGDIVLVKNYRNE